MRLRSKLSRSPGPSPLVEECMADRCSGPASPMAPLSQFSTLVAFVSASWAFVAELQRVSVSPGIAHSAYLQQDWHKGCSKSLILSVSPLIKVSRPPLYYSVHAAPKMVDLLILHPLPLARIHLGSSKNPQYRPFWGPYSCSCSHLSHSVLAFPRAFFVPRLRVSPFSNRLLS